MIIASAALSHPRSNLFVHARTLRRPSRGCRPLPRRICSEFIANLLRICSACHQDSRHNVSASLPSTAASGALVERIRLSAPRTSASAWHRAERVASRGRTGPRWTPPVDSPACPCLGVALAQFGCESQAANLNTLANFGVCEFVATIISECKTHFGETVRAESCDFLLRIKCSEKFASELRSRILVH